MLMVCRSCTAKFAVGLHRCPQCTAEDAYPEGEELPVPKLNSEGVTDAGFYADHEGDLDPVEATAAGAREAAGIVLDETSSSEDAGEGVLEAAPSRPADDARKTEWQTYVKALDGEPGDLTVAQLKELADELERGRESSAPDAS